MNKKILLFLFTFCFTATIFAQDPIELTNSCSTGYGQGPYYYEGINEGKPWYRFYSGIAQGDCSHQTTQLNCERDAIYHLIWETDAWYWKREPFQCQWEEMFGECVPSADGVYGDADGPFTYLYANTSNTPEPPTSGWTALPTVLPGYCEPSLAVLSTKSFLGSEFKLYPNPVKSDGIVTIKFGTSLEKIKVSIYNVLGQLLDKEEFENTSIINLSIKQPQGNYFLKIQSGNQVTVKRIAVR